MDRRGFLAGTGAVTVADAIGLNKGARRARMLGKRAG
jgi:hypothetical protein